MSTTASDNPGRRATALVLAGRLAAFVTLVPAVVMCITLVALVLYCRSLLTAAAAGEHVVVGEAGFWLVVGGFLGACAGVAVLQARRLGRLVAGPELRLVRSLQRMRSGDLDFQVRLRNGDLLNGLANECNELLAVLRRGPQPGGLSAPDRERP